MANSNANDKLPIRWGNVKKIDVGRQIIDGWFYEMKSINDELENIKVSISNISYEKDKEISGLKAEIESLNQELKKYRGQ